MGVELQSEKRSEMAYFIMTVFWFLVSATLMIAIINL